MEKRGKISATFKFLRERPLLSLAIGTGIVAGFVFLNVQAMHYTSKPQFCAKCHNAKTPGPLGEVHTWSLNIHAKHNISCLDCHSGPGIFSYLKAKIKGLGDVYSFVFRGKDHMIQKLDQIHKDPTLQAKVYSMDSCLFCHSTEYNEKFRKERVITLAGLSFRTLDKIKNSEYLKVKNMIDIMSDQVKDNYEVNPKHSIHIKAGINCVICHRGVVHSGEEIKLVSKSINEGENMCFKCHMENRDKIKMSDINIAKAGYPAKFSHQLHSQIFECQTCHPGLFKMKAGTTTISFADHSKDVACFVCHGEKKSANFNCQSCHQQ